MSEIDNLETLSNAELRGKIKEYGLQNIPVTDSSRNVIIKRIRASMGGSATPAKKTGRRETIAAVERASPAKVAQTSNEPAAKTAAANRRTIAVASKDTADGNQIVNRRRSVNVAAAPARDLPSSKSTAQPRNPATIVLDSDDEDDVVAAAEKFEKQQRQQRRSTSRAPSLSKTAVVVTAFNQNLETLAEENSSLAASATAVSADAHRQMKELSAAAEEEALRQMKEVTAAAAAAEARRNYLQEREMHKLQEQLREQELTKQRELLKQQQLQEQLRRQQQAHQEQLLKQQEEQQEQLRYKQQQHNRDERIASFTRIYEGGSQFAAKPLATSTMSSNIYPRLDAGLYNSRAFSGTSASARVMSGATEFSDDTEAEEPKSDEQIDSPFLSHFARNLKRLQAEPLRASPGGDLTRRFARSRTAHEVTGRVALPRAYARPENVGLMQRLSYINRKYHLVRHFFLLFVFVLVFYLGYQFWK